MTQIQCPTCGASISSVIVNCSYCGTEIAHVSTIDKQEYIKAVQHRIETVMADNPKTRRTFDSSYAISNAISLIPIPNDITLIVELFLLCHGNWHVNNVCVDPHEQIIADAWTAKAAAAYDRLTLAALNDSRLSDFLKRYEELYSPKALQNKEDLKRKKEKSELNMVVGVAVIGLAIAFAMMYFITKAIV